MSSDKDNETIWNEWQDLVNMAPKELSDWLDTDDSKSVGADSGDGESKGRKSGKQIVKIKRKRKDELDEDDYQHMAKAVGYIKRHLSQGGPENSVETSNWRYSLMNWGHDPCL